MVERVVNVTLHVDIMPEQVVSVVVVEHGTTSTVVAVVATLAVAVDTTALVEEVEVPTIWAPIRHPTRVSVLVMGML